MKSAEGSVSGAGGAGETESALSLSRHPRRVSVAIPRQSPLSFISSSSSSETMILIVCIARPTQARLSAVDSYLWCSRVGSRPLYPQLGEGLDVIFGAQDEAVRSIGSDVVQLLFLLLLKPNAVAIG